MKLETFDGEQEGHLEIKSLKKELAELEIRKFNALKRIEYLENEIYKDAKKELGVK